MAIAVGAKLRPACRMLLSERRGDSLLIDAHATQVVEQSVEDAQMSNSYWGSMPVLSETR